MNEVTRLKQEKLEADLAELENPDNPNNWVFTGAQILHEIPHDLQELGWLEKKYEKATITALKKEVKLLQGWIDNNGKPDHLVWSDLFIRRYKAEIRMMNRFISNKRAKNARSKK